MKRLTIRNSDGSVSQPTSTTVSAVFEKLAAYEDLEEQGRLIVLPCKVGDTVYVVVRGKIRKAKVDSVYYDGKSIGIVYSYNHFGACVGSGKTVFLSRAEAEAAMKGVSEDA